MVQRKSSLQGKELIVDKLINFGLWFLWFKIFPSEIFYFFFGINSKLSFCPIQLQLSKTYSMALI